MEKQQSLNGPVYINNIVSRIGMKLVAKIVGVALLLLAALYYGSFLIMPSVTVKNESGADIQSVYIRLPDSGLNLGRIEHHQQNTVHYALQQRNGAYQFHIAYSKDNVITGSCGTVTNFEIHKRVLLQVKKQEVICSF